MTDHGSSDADSFESEKYDINLRTNTTLSTPYICDTCGQTGHIRKMCPYIDYDDVNRSDLKWSDSPIGNYWLTCGFNHFDYKRKLSECPMKDAAKDHQSLAHISGRSHNPKKRKPRWRKPKLLENGCTVCVCMCVYECMYMCMYVCMYGHVYVYVYVYVQVCLSACMYVNVLRMYVYYGYSLHGYTTSPYSSQPL